MSPHDRARTDAAPVPAVWDPAWREVVWGQFGAALDMLGNAIRDCPAALWDDPARPPRFGSVAFHTLFWLDLYLHGSVEGFAPPAPFTLDELDPAGVEPARAFTQDELLAYLAHGRERCRATLAGLTAERAARRCAFGWGEVRFLELLLYNLRHVQHHTGQLHLLLRQRTDAAPGWVARAQGGSGGAGAP